VEVKGGREGVIHQEIIMVMMMMSKAAAQIPTLVFHGGP